MKVLKMLRRRASNAKAKAILSRLDSANIVPKIKARRITYLSEEKLLQLMQSLQDIKDAGIEGRIVEAGCALGGSLALIARYAPDRPISVYDTFEMIPPPGPEDPPEVHERYEIIASGKSEGLGGDTYYGYRGDLREFVMTQITELAGSEAAGRVELHKGLLQDTMHLQDPVAFAHIDVDWYDPVMTSIVRLWPLLPVGGIIVFDDYFDWGGCKKAVDEFFDGREDMRFDSGAGNLKVQKTADANP